MTTNSKFQIVFPDWYDERGEWEAREKGWLQGVEVHLADGRVETLFFYDPVRLAQDLDSETQNGKPFIAHPGLIVVKEVTRDAIVVAINKLADFDYFAARPEPHPVAKSCA
jgi:hypothetical protein